MPDEQLSAAGKGKGSSGSLWILAVPDQFVRVIIPVGCVQGDKFLAHGICDVLK